MQLPPKTKLEWEVKDESSAIAITQLPQRSTFHHHAAKLGRRWHLIVFAGALLLLASFIAVARLVDRAEHNIAQTHREIELAVEADSFLRDPAAPTPQIQSIDLQNDLAIVHIAVDEDVHSAGKPMADETVFYHQSGGKWERVEVNKADETTQRPYRSQETAHLLFQYHQEDQSVVEAIVPTMEAFTADLQQDIGLEQVAHEKVTVRIALVAAPQQADPFALVGYTTWDSYGIVVLSPRLARSSTTLASADTLSQAVKATVAYRSILFAVEEYQPQAIWQPLVDGLQLWAYSTPREFDSDLANNMNNLLHYQLTNEAPMRLPILPQVPPSLTDTQETPDIRWQQSVLAKSVIDYAVATYGRRSLARLLEGMHEVDTWQSLIPAVYNVSMEEFENSWQAYLAATICIPKPTSVRVFTNQFITPGTCE